MTTTPKVSVIIPAYNEATRIGRCLKALQAQTYPKDLLEVIVVDNNSHDETAEVVRSHGFTCLDEPRQNAEIARNTGVRGSSGEVLAFTDADCAPDPGWIAAGVKRLEEHELVGGHVQFSFPGSRRGIWQIYDACFNLQHAQSVPDRGLAFTANLFVHRRVFDDIGGFPEDCFGGGDLLFTRSATLSGRKLGFAKDAVVDHPARDFSELRRKALRIGTEKGATFIKDRRERQPVHKGAAVQKPHFVGLDPSQMKQRMQRQNIKFTWPRYVGLMFCNGIYLWFGLFGFVFGLVKGATTARAPEVMTND